MAKPSRQHNVAKVTPIEVEGEQGEKCFPLSQPLGGSGARAGQLALFRRPVFIMTETLNGNEGCFAHSQLASGEQCGGGMINLPSKRSPSEQERSVCGVVSDAVRSCVSNSIRSDPI